MKTFIFFLAMLFTFSSQAQKKASEKAVISTPGVRDEVCKTRLENELSRQKDITGVKVDYKKHTVAVTWVRDRTNIEIIKTVIANMGYDADDVTAGPSAYKKLPKACQHPIEKKIDDNQQLLITNYFMTLL